MILNKQKFIEEWIQVKQSDGSYKKMILRDIDIEMLKAIENAKNNNKQLIIKPR